MISWDNSAQGSPEWLALRKQMATASNANTLAGKSDTRAKYLRRVAWHIVNGPDDGEEPGYKSAAMERGNVLEPHACDAAAEQFGLLLSEVGVCFNDEWPFCGASLDRLDIGGKVAVEVKCPMLDTMLDYEEKPEKLLSKYRRQCAIQMIIAELDTVYLYAWHPRQRPIWHRLERDSWSDEISEMEEHLSRAIVDIQRYKRHYEETSTWLTT